MGWFLSSRPWSPTAWLAPTTPLAIGVLVVIRKRPFGRRVARVIVAIVPPIPLARPVVSPGDAVARSSSTIRAVGAGLARVARRARQGLWLFFARVSGRRAARRRRVAAARTSASLFRRRAAFLVPAWLLLPQLAVRGVYRRDGAGYALLGFAGALDALSGWCSLSAVLEELGCDGAQGGQREFPCRWSVMVIDRSGRRDGHRALCADNSPGPPSEDHSQ